MQDRGFFNNKSGVFLSAFACFALTLWFIQSETAEKFDRFLLDQRFQFLTSKVETQTIVVEIDTMSLQAMPNWPWSRSVHGDLVDILGAAGSKAILFDVDFSAVGNEAGDRAFSKALSRSPAPVYLASHRQALSADFPGITAEILPNAVLREHARLAAVNYPIDSDGVIRRANVSQEFSFGTISSIGSAALPPSKLNQYIIDFSISLESLERISYIDVLEGEHPEDMFKGKVVFIGATALELGDEYVIPNHGLSSGVYVNALAHESLRLGRALKDADRISIAVIALVICATLLVAPMRSYNIRSGTAHALLATALLIGPLLAQRYLQVVVPASSLHFAQVMCLFVVTAMELEKRALRAFIARMAEQDGRALLHTLITDSAEGYIVVNESGKIEICNPRACELMGCSRDDVIGDQVTIALPTLIQKVTNQNGDCGVYSRYLIEVPDSQANFERTLEVTLNQSIVPLSKSRFEQRKRPRKFSVYALHDITAQKRAEQAERQAKESHAKMSAAKSQLISNMSHELRTPLNSIIGFSEVLLADDSQIVNSTDQREYARMINESGRNLLSVLNDMLYSAKVQSDELQLENNEVLVEDLIESALSKVRKKASWSDQQVSLSANGGCTTVYCDPNAMEYALVHIIDNAAKFSGRDGQIRISVDRTENETAVVVADDGPGCSDEVLPKLCEMFFQAEGSLNRSHEGTGLGLFLANKLVEFQGGALSLRSHPGLGFEVKIIFPNPCASVVAHKAA